MVEDLKQKQNHRLTFQIFDDAKTISHEHGQIDLYFVLERIDVHFDA